MSIKSKEDLLNKQAEVNEQIKSYTCRVLVCSGTGCVATGSQKIYEKFMEIAKDAPGVTIEFGPHDKDAHVGVKKTGCQGVCELGPLVRIQKGDDVIQYTKVQIEDCQEIFEKSVQGNETIERLLYQKGGKVSRGPEDIPFIAKQTRIVLKNCGKFDAESLNEYIASGGFQALEKAMFEMNPDLVIDQVDKSGIRGRGGGGFPAGKKWIQVARQADPVHYVVCNGDEGDPGAFMDGSVMEGDPYRLIEGMMLAAYAVRAQHGYIYVRAEYPQSVARLKHAIAVLEEVGLLGDDILGTGFSFHMHINRGAGAFVCGEGSALTASIEGNRGMPRVKPPRTVEKGLWEKPTVLNNVETYANVPKIILEGADWFHWSGITPAISDKAAELTRLACEAAKRHGVTVSVDLNFRKKLWTKEKAQSIMKPLMQYVDVCIGNEEDAELCLGFKPDADVEGGKTDAEGYKGIFKAMAKEFGFKYVISTLRESFSATHNGWKAMIYNGEEFYESKRYDINPIVDRVGGGDSFSGGIIHGLLTKPNQGAALEFAVAASALKHTINGDFNLVSTEEVEALAGGDASGRVQR